MTDIYCSAHHCAHNKNNSCCLESVHVGGTRAKTTDGTNCDSFIREHAVMSLSEQVCHSATINCDAENCKYNREGECDAENIDVAGENSCTCGETCCETFKK